MRRAHTGFLQHAICAKCEGVVFRPLRETVRTAFNRADRSLRCIEAALRDRPSIEGWELTGCELNSLVGEALFRNEHGLAADA